LLAHADERDDEARAHLEASRALSADPRLPFPLGRSSLGLAESAKEDEDLENARELAHEALEILDGYGDRVGAAAALEAIADLAVALGHPERSLRLLASSCSTSPTAEISPSPVMFSDIFCVIFAGTATRDPGESSRATNAPTT
jgi:hypothetical protein